MTEKGAERLFLCFDNEYKNKAKNDIPNINKIIDRYPIILMSSIFAGVKL